MCPEFGKGAGFVLWRRALGGMEIERLCLGFWGLRLRGEGWEGGIVGICGMCERARGMGMVCGGEGARRGRSWFLSYARTELWRIVARAPRLEALGPCVHGYGTQLHGTARQRVCRSGTQLERFLSQSRPSTYPMLHLTLHYMQNIKNPRVRQRTAKQNRAAGVTVG